MTEEMVVRCTVCGAEVLPNDETNIWFHANGDTSHRVFRGRKLGAA